MKGRMFVVNETTLAKTIRTNTVSVFVPDAICDSNPEKGKQWLKTVADIMADMLQVEVGDYIFLWKTSSSEHKSRIYGVYRAISKPYYECTDGNDKAPFKIRIEKAYDFNNPLDEYEVLNCPYIKNTLWTIIGKKVAGKSRGTSPLSPDEVKHLITLLIGKNDTYSYCEWNYTREIAITKPLQIDYTKTGTSVKPTSLSAFHPNDICYINYNNNVFYEKILETILNQEMSNKNLTLFNQLGIDVTKVIWYSNYLPYSIEQSEMDYVIIESEDKMCFSKIFVIELQKERIDEDHIKRCLLYSKWVNETLALGANIVQPMLVCLTSYDFINEESLSKAMEQRKKDLETTITEYSKKYAVKDLQIFEYSLLPEIKFVRKR